jgi:translation elongation factor EF-Tu-like GTPase
MKKGELILEIEDVFFTYGKGTIVVGRVMCDYVEINHSIIIDPIFLPEFKSKIIGIEMFRKFVNTANFNDNVGLLIDDVDKKQVKKRMKIYKLTT